jgi:hypothetical protein
MICAGIPFWSPVPGFSLREQALARFQLGVGPKHAQAIYPSLSDHPAGFANYQGARDYSLAKRGMEEVVAIEK